MPPNHPGYNGKVLTKQPSAYQSTMLLHCFLWVSTSEWIYHTSQQNYDPLYHLSLSDIALDHWHAQTTVRLHIKQSKMDPLKKGAYIYLAKTNQLVCPIQAIVGYLTIRWRKKGHCSLLLIVQCSQRICSLKPWPRSCTNWTWTLNSTTHIASVSVQQHQLIKQAYLTFPSRP